MSGREVERRDRSGGMWNALREPCDLAITMPYALEPDEPVPAGVRRIAREQVDGALVSLRRAARAPDQADPGIHDARKRFKKTRAVLRLVREELGGEAYHRENRAYRDAGRLLADVRETAVLPATVAGLVERYGGVLNPEPLRPLVDGLDARHAATIADALGKRGGLDRAVSMTEAARERIDRWPLAGGGFTILGPGLRKVYERGRSRMADAYADPSGPRFHEWRKRATYLWCHLRILAPTWPDVLGSWAGVQHDLTDMLGEANDLSDLLRFLEEWPDLSPDTRPSDAVWGIAEARRTELWERARPLGMRLYAESPDRFVERMGSYWEATRRDGRPPRGSS